MKWPGADPEARTVESRCAVLEGRRSKPHEAGTPARLLGRAAQPVPRAARAGGRAPRLRLGVDGRGVGIRRVHARRVDRRAHRAHPPVHRHRADLGAHARVDARCPRSRSTISPTGASASGSACPARRWSRVGTGSRSASRSRGRASTSTSCGRCCGARRRCRSRASTTGCRTTARTRGGSASRCKSITHPLRADLPIFLGAEGPKNVALAAEIADGWLPLYYSPFRPEVYSESLGAARPGFEICVTVMGCAITDDVEAGLMPTKAALAFYIGGHGREGPQLPHGADEPHGLRGGGARGSRSSSSRASATRRSRSCRPSSPTRSRSSGRRSGSATGSQAWDASPVTTIIISGDVDTLRTMAELTA